MHCTWLPCDAGVLRCSRCGREIRCRERLPVANCVLLVDPAARLLVPERLAEPASGCLAGTALTALLGKLGIKSDEKGCKCKSRAAQMDAAGCDWVEENIDTIVGWLREEATKRRLPFLDAAGRLLVRRAIRNAKRAAAS